MEWDIFMDIAIATLGGALVGVAGSVLINWLGNRRGYKDIDAKIGTLENQTLVGFIRSKIGVLSNDTLSDQHKHIEEVFNLKVGDLQNTTLSGQNITILNRVKELKDTYEATQREEALKRQLLTGHQESIVQSLSVLGSFQKELIDLQNEKLSLLKQVEGLKRENTQLQEQVAELEEQLGIEQQMEM